MTEVVQRSAGDTVAVLIEKYPVLDPDGEAFDLLVANIGDMDDAGLSFGDMDRLTMPPGGTTRWLVPDLTEGEISLDELVGIVLRWETSRAFWESDDVTGEAPDCASRDGRMPIPEGLFAADGERAAENPGGTCKDCPMNQFGSATKGNGKKCKESKLLYLMRPGELLPTIVSLPPTSIKPLKSFLLRLATKAQAKYNQAEIGLTVKVVVGGPGNGQKYGVVVPRLVRVLDPAERVLTQGASDQFDGMLNRAPIAAIANTVVEEDAATDS